MDNVMHLIEGSLVRYIGSDDFNRLSPIRKGCVAKLSWVSGDIACLGWYDDSGRVISLATCLTVDLVSATK
jgi:hypothetical protein